MQKDINPAGKSEPHEEDNEEEQEMSINGNHLLSTTKYGSEVLLGMMTKVSYIRRKDEPPLSLEALADSVAYASILSFDLTIKFMMKI